MFVNAGFESVNIYNSVASGARGRGFESRIARTVTYSPINIYSLCTSLTPFGPRPYCEKSVKRGEVVAYCLFANNPETFQRIYILRKCYISVCNSTC